MLRAELLDLIDRFARELNQVERLHEHRPRLVFQIKRKSMPVGRDRHGSKVDCDLSSCLPYAS